MEAQKEEAACPPELIQDPRRDPAEVILYGQGAGLYSWLNTIDQLSDPLDHIPFVLYN